MGLGIAVLTQSVLRSRIICIRFRFNYTSYLAILQYCRVGAKTPFHFCKKRKKGKINALFALSAALHDRK
jgi:hypothetical protein